MEYRNILRNIKDKKFHPIYFLHGEEAYFIDIISNYISETVLSEEEKEFNQTVLYGRDSTYEHVISNVRSYPMMASHRVVILKEAQQFKDLDLLEAYFQKPVPSTILVVCYKHGMLDKRKKLNKVITGNKNILSFAAQTLNENQLIDWIRAYCTQKKILVDPRAAFALKELLGDEISKIAKEIDKFANSLPEGSQIKLEEIQSNVGMSREFNAFEFQSALAARNITRAHTIVNFFAKNPSAGPMPMVMGLLYSFFVKVLIARANGVRNENELRQKFKLYLHEPDLSNALKYYSLPKLQEIMQLLNEYDLKSKGLGAFSPNHGDLMREMVYRITH